MVASAYFWLIREVWKSQMDAAKVVRLTDIFL